MLETCAECDGGAAMCLESEQARHSVYYLEVESCTIWASSLREFVLTHVILAPGACGMEVPSSS